MIHEIRLHEDKTEKYQYHVLCNCFVEGRFVALGDAREFASLHATNQKGINSAKITDETDKKPADAAPSEPPAPALKKKV
jgi:hypothetical protein